MNILNQMQIVWDICGKNIWLCGIGSLISIVLFSIFIFFLIKKLISILKKAWGWISEKRAKYGEDRLYLKTIKQIGNYSFIKLLIYQYIIQKIVSPLKQIYYPSPSSLIVTIIVSLILFYLPGIDIQNYKFFSHPESNHYQNFLAVHAIIGAIIFAFLILIAETSNSGKNHNRARLILKETLLFPLATSEIISLFLFSIGNNDLGSIISVFVVGGFTIRAIYKVTKLFINRYILEEKERELVNDRFSARLDQAVKERIATNTLIEYFKKSKYSIDYSYFRVSREDRKTISLSRKGVLSDIHLGKLEKLLDQIEKTANELELSIRKNPTKDKKAGRLSGRVSQLIDEKYHGVEISVLKLIGYPLDEDSLEILALPKSLYENKELRTKIEKEINGIFITKPQDSIEKEIRLELDEAKDKAFEAIANSKVGILGSVMTTYESLIDKFLDVFQTYGGGYSHDAARKERSSIFGGWPYIRWIREDLYDVLSETIKTENEKLIREVVHTPMEILFKAFVKKDHLISQEFITYQSYLYWETKKIKDKKIKDYLIDRASRYLKEFADYRITPKLEDHEIKPEEVTHIRDFIYEILQTYKYMLKYAFDNRDVTSFNKYIQDAKNILHRFEPSKDSRKIHTEIRLKAQDLTDTQKSELENELSLVTLLEETEAQIESKKLELIFGVAAWCLDKLKISEFKDETLLTMWNNLLPYLPTRIDKLMQIYEISYQHKTQDFWGWDWWELEEKRGNSDGVITGTIEFDRKVHTLFTVLLLKASKGNTVDQIDISKINVSRDSMFYFDKVDGSIKNLLDDICKNSASWEKVLNSEEINSKDVALGVLDKFVDKQKKEEALVLINTEIDSEKVNGFIKNFISGYEETITIRRLLDMFNVVNDTKIVSQNKNYWGFNEIQDKEPFLSSWHIDYGDFGEHYGRGLADSEDQVIFGQIRSNSILEKSNPSFSDVVKNGLQSLTEKGFKPSIIITTFHLGEWRKATLNDAEFIPAYQVKDEKFKSIPNFIGLYKFNRRKIPIFHIWVNRGGNEAPEVIIADIKKLLEIDQYLPYIDDNEKQGMQIEKNFGFKITDLSSESSKGTRDELIKKNPEWLKKYSDKESYLKQKVIVYVKEKYEVKIKEKEASIRTIIKVDEED